MKNNFGFSLLRMAISANNLDIVDRILTEAKNEKILTELFEHTSGYNALLKSAIDTDNPDVVDRILTAAKDVGMLQNILDTITNESGWLTPIMDYLFLGIRMRPNETLLGSVINKSNPQTIEKVLAAAKDVGMLEKMLNTENYNHYLPLHDAIQNQEVQMLEKILTIAKDAGMLKKILGTVYGGKDYYLEYGDDDIYERDIRPSYSDAFVSFLFGREKLVGKTILHIAIWDSNPEKVEKILAVAKDAGMLKWLLNTKDKYGDQPLHSAVGSYRPNKAVVEKILNAARDDRILEDILHSKNKAGKTPIGLSGRYNNEIRSLLDNVVMRF
ncbi:hypothetical protein [Candidatus Bandiella euplotis]|nr:hypothetical protein [Candidatus Bandiella woodruffii]